MKNLIRIEPCGYCATVKCAYKECPKEIVRPLTEVKHGRSIHCGPRCGGLDRTSGKRMQILCKCKSTKLTVRPCDMKKQKDFYCLGNKCRKIHPPGRIRGKKNYENNNFKEANMQCSSQWCCGKITPHHRLKGTIYTCHLCGKNRKESLN